MLTIITGAQDGDEGKGRIVHNLALNGNFFAGARAQGGNNAGHTVVHDGVTYKLHLLPTPVLLGKHGYLGRAMAIDLDVLVNEISSLKNKGLEPEITLDPRAHVIMPWHKDLDRINEKKNGHYAAGSTGRGIGPCYASKHERTGVRVADFFGNKDRVEMLVKDYAARVFYQGESERSINFLQNVYRNSIDDTFNKTSFLQKYLRDVSILVSQDLSERKHILGECAQAEMLDVDSPYYPQGTSSGTGAAGFMNGLGLFNYKEIKQVIGVAKPYVTRVGNGAFVTEVDGNLADVLREKGGEYGTTTGRPRRVGWFDVLMLLYAKRSSGLDSIALTKIDILGGLDEVPIAVRYADGNDIPCLGYDKKIPVYEIMSGWPNFSAEEYRRELEGGISKVKNTALREYLEKIQSEVDLPISMISFGQDSKDFVSYL